MFLLNSFNQKDSSYLVFLDLKTKEIKYFKLNSDTHYFIRSLEPDETIESEIIEGYAFESKVQKEKTRFVKYKCLPSQEREIIKKQQEEYPFSRFYDIQVDTVNRFCLENNIKLYCNYEITNTIDSLKYLNDDLSLLKKLTISIKIQNSNSTIKIPRVCEIHESKQDLKCEFTKQEIDFIEIQEIISIECFDGNTHIKFDSIFEYQNILDFLDYFKKFNPDVVQTFNWTQIHYLWQRCLWFKEKKIDENLPELFINTLSRNSENKLSVDELCYFTFPRYKLKNGNYTSAFIETDCFSKTCFKYQFKNVLFNRIVVNCWMLEMDEINWDPYDIIKVHNYIQKKRYLNLLLQMTGRDLNTTYDKYLNKMLLCHNTIKKYNPYVFLHYPIIEEKIKIPGGMNINIESKVNKGDIIIIDYNHFYPSLILKHNLSLDCLTHNGNLVYYNEKDTLNLLPKEKREGAIPRTIQALLDKRYTIESRIKIAKDLETKENLNIIKTTTKLNTNIVYGIMGLQSTANKLTAPELASAITHNGAIWLQTLIEKLEPFGEIISADTDGVMMKRESNIDEVLKEINTLSGGFLKPEIKSKLKAVIPIHKKTWVGIDSNNEFLNKGVITVTDRPFIKAFKKEMYTFLMCKKVTLESFLEKLKTFLSDWKTNESVYEIKWFLPSIFKAYMKQDKLFDDFMVLVLEIFKITKLQDKNKEIEKTLLIWSKSLK
jgi:hypothetical protein